MINQSAVTPHDCNEEVDFPSLNELFVAIGCEEWILHGEPWKLQPHHMHQNKDILSLTSVTPSLILESAVITKYFQKPPEKAVIHAFGKMAPLDHCPLQSTDLTMTLSDIYKVKSKNL